MVLILVIHADPTVRAMVAEVLDQEGQEGHEVVTAPNGREGLRLIREAPRPAIVLLDLMLPVLGGRGVMRALQADPELRARHALILWSAAPNLEANSDLGADWTLALPFTVDQFLDALAHGEQVLKSRQGEGI